MKKNITTLILSLLISFPVMAKTVVFRIIETTDVHGSFFPYDFLNDKPKDGSLARVSYYVDSLRAQYGENVILLDNGDILQGQPLNYFSNFVDTTHTNIAADILNYMKYDAATIGNHDMETGHKVYDKWISEVSCPVLGANIINKATQKPYLSPYVIIQRNGIKIAVIGLLTPAIPNWLSEDVYQGLQFDEMVKSARYWMDYVQQHEQPDIVIGLFHSGKEGGIKTDKYDENAALKVAQEVSGFDVVFFGHDHRRFAGTVKDSKGKTVVCLNPANNAMSVADATITVTTDESGIKTKVNGRIVDISHGTINQAFVKQFQPFLKRVKKFDDKKVGTFKNAISTRDSYFGSSAFNDLILNLELEITGADIAFNAPLSFDATINKGPIKVKDMFKLYKYENQIYVMRLTGKEIHDYLEMSYDLWVNTMKGPQDHLLLFSETSNDNKERYSFKNFSYNFDSAAGIDYTVDVSKPNGQKVQIQRMSNGQPFDESKWYKVAVNSYRANGGGELLTKGAHIAHDKLNERIVWKSQKDQRYYLMKEIEDAKTMDPKPNNNWRFIPEEWVKEAAARDYKLLYGDRKEAE